MATKSSPTPRDRARGETLRRWRKERGITQVDLGLAAGYLTEGASSKNVGITISKIEAGRITPPPERLEKILVRLGHTQKELDTAILRTTSKVSPAYRLLAGSTAVRNEERRASLIHESELLQRQVTLAHRAWSESVQNATNTFVIPSISIATKIDWQSNLEKPTEGADDQQDDLYGGIPLSDQVKSVRASTRARVVREVATAGAGGMAGAGFGAAAAAGVFTAVSTFATASTGTAIAALSGVAATNATLAWLGGGSLATGGMGMAGGTLVLGGVVALPALLAMGGLIAWQGKRLRNQADQEGENLRIAERAQLEMKSKFERAFRWCDLQRDVLDRAASLGAAISGQHIETAVSPQEETARVPFSELPQRTQAALDAVLQIVALVVDTQALPVWLEVTSIDPSGDSLGPNDPETAQATRGTGEWIEQSLILAGLELDDLENHWRSFLSPIV